MNRMKTAGFVVLLVIGLFGCEGGQDVVSPSFEQGAATTSSLDSADCPTFEAMCASMVAQVKSLCPEEAATNHGQLQSCRMHAINEVMASMPDCYTSSQRWEIKKSVMAALGLDNLIGDRTGSKRNFRQE